MHNKGKHLSNWL